MKKSLEKIKLNSKLNSNMKFICNIATLSLVTLLIGCQSGPPKDVLKTPENALQMRSLQCRGYDTRDEKKILSASAAALQDMGFTLEDSETKLGLVVAVKDADATNKAQVALAATTMVLGALSGSVSTASYGDLDDVQKVRASLVTMPGSKNKDTVIRITFQRVVWNKNKQITRMETLEDPKLYQGFFDRLSKSVFLEEHQI